GDLLEVCRSGGDTVLHLFIERIVSRPRGARLAAGRGFWRRRAAGSPEEPDTAASWADADEDDGVQRWREANGSSPGAAAPTVHLLRFELHARLPEGAAFRLGNLAFGPTHPRFWGRLPTDEHLFGPPTGRPAPLPRPEIEAFVAEAAMPRFPLAGPGPEAPARASLPMAMPSRAGAGPAAGPLDTTANPLRRDGLQRFSAALFLDPDLAGVGLAALLREAEHKAYLRQQPLRGLHSLLPIDEVTLIAVPDAGHRTWDRGAPPAAPLLPAPRLDPLPEDADEAGRHRVSWSRVADATGYLLQGADDPAFARPATLYAGAEPEIRVALAEGCPRPRWVRVRALRQQQASAWSETRGRVLPPVDFLACAAVPIVELRLRAVPLLAPGTGTLLRWAADDGTSLPPDAEAELQQADEWDFLDPLVRRLAGASETTVAAGRDGVQHFRVRLRHGDAAGPWSNTVSVRPVARTSATLRPTADDDDGDLLAVHRALIRFAAARGDLLAVLTLPRHYRRAGVEAHIGALLPAAVPAPPPAAAGIVAGVLPLAPGEAAAAGYAALFHPWLATASAAPGDRTALVGLADAPPDGAMIGLMARLAAAEGAWLAPANRPLAGVLALDPRLSEADRRAQIAAHANPLAADARGF
ncbi:MAG TPA: hypothetical protein VES39_05080, partial [Rhodospirillales bacterium]|nr:hypothetical protein [Rhodospirillales bacterium]